MNFPNTCGEDLVPPCAQCPRGNLVGVCRLHKVNCMDLVRNLVRPATDKAQPTSEETAQLEATHLPTHRPEGSGQLGHSEPTAAFHGWR